MQSVSYRLNSQIIREAIKDSGFSSIRDFANKLGLHRNTILDYLNLKAKPIPEGLEKILSFLRLHPKDVLIENSTINERTEEPLLSFIDKLVTLCPGVAFILYGSRARGTAKKYSDYDIGLYALKRLPFPEFSKLLDLVNDWNDNHILTVQLTNLNDADTNFLANISNDMKFIGGRPEAWNLLLKTSSKARYEEKY